MYYSENKCAVMKKTRFSGLMMTIVVTVIAMSLTGCELKGELQRLVDSASSGRQIPDSVALAVVNQQNADRYQLLKETVLAMSELSGPIQQMEGGDMTLAEEIRLRVRMVKERISKLEKMASEPADQALVQGLRAQLDGMQVKVKYLEKTVALQDGELKRSREELQRTNDELQAAYSRLQQELIAKERLNNELMNERSRLARILYQVACDYENLGEAIGQANSSKARRNLRSICLDNAQIRFRDAQNLGNMYIRKETEEVWCSSQ